MPRTRGTHTARAGLFVLLGGGLVLAGIAFVAGLAVLQRYDHYTIYFRETVSGLSPGSPVKLRGVEVGRVEDMEIDPENVEQVRVRIRVRRGTPILEGAKAKLKAAGITGLRYIEIQGGRKGAGRLASGSVIPSEPSTLYQITGQAEAIGYKAEKLLNNALELTRPENRQRLWQLVTGAREALEALARLARRLDRLVASLEPHLETTLRETNRSLREVRRASRAIRDLAERTDPRLAATFAETRRTLQELRRSLGNSGELGRAIRRAEASLDRVEAVLAGRDMAANVRRLGRVLDGLDAATRQLRQLTGRVSRDLHPTLRTIRNAAERLEEFARTIQENPAAILRPSTTRRR